MDIADLPPDIRFEPLAKDDDAFRFSLAAKCAALGPYIVQRWGWDDAVQERVHRTRFGEKPFHRIVRVGQPVGTVSFMPEGDHLRFGEFYLFPEFQRQGLGTRILRHCLALADATGRPVRLEYLKWNPVGSLYRRHGFREIGQTDIHFLMEWRSNTYKPQ